MTGLFLAVIMVFMGPAAEYLSDSYVFQWRRQTFAGDLVFVAPIALSIVVAHFAPSLVVVAGVTVLFAWLSYATLNVNYALFAACLTGYIVFCFPWRECRAWRLRIEELSARRWAGRLRLRFVWWCCSGGAQAPTEGVARKRQRQGSKSLEKSVALLRIGAHTPSIAIPQPPPGNPTQADVISNRARFARTSAFVPLGNRRDRRRNELTIYQPPTQKTRSSKATTAVSRRFGVAALAVLAVIFCSGATSPSGCNSSSERIGPSGGEVAGAAIGIGAVIAVAIIVPVKINHSHHTLKGCVFNGPGGFGLRTSNGKTYALEGDPSSIKVGDLVQFHGSKVKKTKDSNGNEVFRVEKLKKEYGPCKVEQVAAKSPHS